MLTAALATWRGDALADIAYELGFADDARRLEELRRTCRLDRIDAQLEIGAAAEIVPELEQLVTNDPLDERSRAQLMRALYRCGRLADALAAYREGRRRLVDELGVEPSPALAQLERRMLQRDPALDAAGHRAGPVADRTVVIVSQSSSDVDSLLGIGGPIVGSTDVELVLVRVLTALPGRDDRTRVRELTRRLARTRDRLAADGIAARVAAFSSPTPGRHVATLAHQQHAALIIVDGTRELLQGRSSIAAELLDASPCDVALHIPNEQPAKGSSILVPFGTRDHDWAALELAARIAGQTRAPLVLAGVIEDRSSAASRALATASLIVQQATGVIAEPLLLAGHGPDPLLEAATDARLLVFGASGRREAAALDDTRSQITSRAPVPCLLVTRGARPGILAPPESMTRFRWSLSKT
jgi:hypothetical protein